MRSILCLGLLCSWAIAGAAQAPDQAVPKKQPPPGTLHTISVKGNRLYSSQAIVQVSGLKVGDRISAAAIEQARKKLQDTELFANVTDEYRFSTGSAVHYDLTFEVSESTQLFPVRFE